jgi:hypothetical protein
VLHCFPHHLCLSFSTLSLTVFSMLSGSSSDDRGRGGGDPLNGAYGSRDLSHIDQAKAPSGTCRFYWSMGSCDLGFDCMFKHEAKPGVAPSSSTSGVGNYTPYFFTAEGLAVNSGSAIDSQHTLSPSEAHNYLKPYLSEKFVFRDASNVEDFSRILASVNSRNKEWVRYNSN